MRVAIYNIENGKIDRFITCPPFCVDIQCEENEEFYLNCPKTATHIINGEAKIQT